MTPNPTTPAPTTEEWMHNSAKEIDKHLFDEITASVTSQQKADASICYQPSPQVADYAAIIAEEYAAAHPTWTHDTTKYRIQLQSIIERLSDERDHLTTALADAKARCAELETRNNQLREESVRQAEWHAELVGGMEARAESAEAQRDRVKAALDAMMAFDLAPIVKGIIKAAISTPPAEEKS